MNVVGREGFFPRQGPPGPAAAWRHLGWNRRAGEWLNPVDSRKLRVCASSLAGGHLADTVDRGALFESEDLPFSWVLFDFQECAVRPCQGGSAAIDAAAPRRFFFVYSSACVCVCPLRGFPHFFPISLKGNSQPHQTSKTRKQDLAAYSNGPKNKSQIRKWIYAGMPVSG